MKVAIGIVKYENKPEFNKYLDYAIKMNPDIDFKVYIKQDIKYGDDFDEIRISKLANLRNELTKEIMKDNETERFDWIAFVDDDLYINPAVFYELKNLNNNEVKALGVVSYSLISNQFLIVDINAGTIQKMPNETTGLKYFKLNKDHYPDQCWIVKPEILEQIGEPYFEYNKSIAKYETYVFAYKISKITDWYILNIICLCDESRNEHQMTYEEQLKKSLSYSPFR